MYAGVDGQVVFHLAITGILLGDLLGGLPVFLGGHGSVQFNCLFRHRNGDVVTAQRGIVLDRSFNLGLNVAAGAGLSS